MFDRPEDVPVGKKFVSSQKAAMKGLYNIFITTAHQAMREPVYYIVTGIFGALVYLSRFFVLFVFEGEEAVIMETGLISMVACGVILGILLSWLLVRKEMERMSVLTVLSKPVSRFSFLAGKYLGVAYAISWSLLLLFLLFMLSLWQSDMQRIHELFFAKNEVPASHWHAVWFTVWGYSDLFLQRWVLPGLKGAITSLTTVWIVVSVCSVSSLFFQILPTIGCTVGFFVLGSLSGNIFRALQDSGNIFGNIFAWGIHLLVPDLQRLNIASEVAGNIHVGMGYLLSALLSGIIYIGIVILFGTGFFQNSEIQ